VVALVAEHFVLLHADRALDDGAADGVDPVLLLTLVVRDEILCRLGRRHLWYTCNGVSS
jgi:hypothetical protein